MPDFSLQKRKTSLIFDKTKIMSRLSEAIFMANCSPNDWTKYAKTHTKYGQPFYLSAISREEAKKLRQIVRINKNETK